MDSRQEHFQKLTLAWLEQNRQRLGFGPPQAGESGGLVAFVPVEGLGMGIRNRVLALGRRDDALIISCHNVLFVGSQGDQVNRVADHLIRKLFLPEGEELQKSLAGEQSDVTGLLVDLYRAGQRTTDELIAHVVQGSNACTCGSRAYVDWRRGEVVVEFYVPCDFETLPGALGDAVMAVLSHAQRLIAVDHVVQQFLTPEPPLPEALLKRLYRSLAAARKTPEARPTPNPAPGAEAEGVTL